MPYTVTASNDVLPPDALASSSADSPDTMHRDTQSPSADSLKHNPDTLSGSKAILHSIPKDRECPFCKQQFTSSSLGRHLDLYIRDRNPKPPDGIHEIEQIKRIRASITRRHSRAMQKDGLNQRRAEQSLPSLSSCLNSPNPTNRTAPMLADAQTTQAPATSTTTTSRNEDKRFSDVAAQQRSNPVGVSKEVTQQHGSISTPSGRTSASATASPISSSPVHQDTYVSGPTKKDGMQAPPLGPLGDNERTVSMWNKADWTATGVINGLPPRSTTAPVPMSNTSARLPPPPQRQQQQQQQQHHQSILPPLIASSLGNGNGSSNHPSSLPQVSAYHNQLHPNHLPPVNSPTTNEASLRATAAESALKSILQTIRAAITRSHKPPSLFSFSPFSLSFPALCIELLPTTTDLAFGSMSSYRAKRDSMRCSAFPPTATHYDCLLAVLVARVGAYHVERARQLAGPHAGDSGMDRQEETFEHYFKHFEETFDEWNALSPTEQQEAWSLEVLRSLERARNERDEIKGDLTKARAEIVALTAEKERKGSQQHRWVGSWGTGARGEQGGAADGSCRNNVCGAGESGDSLSVEVLMSLAEMGRGFKEWDFEKIIERFRARVREQDRERVEGAGDYIHAGIAKAAAAIPAAQPHGSGSWSYNPQQRQDPNQTVQRRQNGDWHGSTLTREDGAQLARTDQSATNLADGSDPQSAGRYIEEPEHYDYDEEEEDDDEEDEEEEEEEDDDEDDDHMTDDNSNYHGQQEQAGDINGRPREGVGDVQMQDGSIMN